jgi:HEAT repeat protein
MPPPAEPLHPGAPDEWPAIELQLGVRLPADYQALIAAYGTGYVADFLNIYNPFSDNPAVRLIDAAASEGDIYREIRTFEHIPYPIHPEPGGLLAWASSFNGDVFFWVTDPPGDPDSWRIAISEVRGPGWFRHPGPLVRFLAEWLSGEAVVPFLPTLDDETSFTPSKPLAELEVEWAASRAVWQADLAKATDGGTKPMPGPGFFGPGFPGWPPTSSDGWLDALANAVGLGQVEAAEHLAGMGPPVLPALLELLDQDHPPMFLSRAILGIGDGAMPGVLAVIEARDGRLSLAAVEVLGGSGDDRALDPLLRGLRNGDSGTRYNAAIGFAKLGRSQGEDALIANLGDPSSGVRRETVTALGVVGGPASVDPVRVLLADPVDHVRAEAARAFGRLAGAAGVADLAALLADRIEKVRVGAIDGLAATGSVAAASALLDRLPALDPRLPVREELGATITALGRLRERRAITALEAVLGADHRDWQPVAGQPTFGALAAAALSAIDGRDEPPLGRRS